MKERILLFDNNLTVVVKETIGCGSFSKVKLAQDRKSGKTYAIKIVNCEKTDMRFLARELALWPTLEHENIIRMHGFRERNLKVFMLLEYASGGDMCSLLNNIKGPIGEPFCGNFMRQLLDAVAFMHGRDICHRDIKLENILLHNGTAKLADFGFVTSASLSRTHCGSTIYAAPEVVRGQEYDPKKADVWSLGVVFFAFLTGTLPFAEYDSLPFVKKVFALQINLCGI
jgi:serine/threonine protein kinase